MWHVPPPSPAPPEAQCSYGPITLTVGPSYRNDGQQHMFLSLQLGRLSSRERNACLHAWPREAIKLARVALDEFENWLEGQS